MTQAGRIRLLAFVAFAVALVALLAWNRPASRGRGLSDAMHRPDRISHAPAATPARIGPRVAPGVPAARHELDAGDAATAEQMACSQAVASLLARRLHSAEVRETPRLAAAAVLISEHLRMVRAVSTRSAVSLTDMPALERAVRRSPEDPSLARLYAARCNWQQCADHQAAFARLVALEPDNLATWMLAPYDGRHPSPAVDDAWLARAVRTTYFDPGWRELAFSVVEAAGPSPDLPACDGPMRAMEPHLDRDPLPGDAIRIQAHVMAMQQITLNRAMWNACPLKGLPPRRRANCQKVHRLLAESTDAVHATGSLRWLVVHAQPEAERLRWQARWRDLQWAMHAADTADALSLRNLPLIWEEGEIPVLIAYLQERGQWPAPPDWQPTPSQ